MATSSPPCSRALALVAREFGDALLALRSIEALSQANPKLMWTVWCRPKTAALFRNHPNIDEIVENQFPMGAQWAFGFLEALRLLRSCLVLRFRRRFLFSLDFLGDTREATLCIIANNRKHFSPSWGKTHELSKLIYTAPKRLLPNAVTINTTGQSVYTHYDTLISQLAQSTGLAAPQIDSRTTRQCPPIEGRIGIHPTGTSPSKSWPVNHWHTLIDSLQTAGYSVVIFGAPNERAELLRAFSGHIPNDHIITESLTAFEASVSQLMALVGLDSFSVHMAYRTGVPAIILNSANHPKLWTPPGAKICRTEGLCPQQPCLHAAPCAKTESAYICMKRLTPQNVLEQTLTLLQKGD